MSDTLFHLIIHYDARDVSEIDARERVEQALGIACTHLETFDDSTYIGYKIRELTSLD